MLSDPEVVVNKLLPVGAAVLMLGGLLGGPLGASPARGTTPATSSSTASEPTASPPAAPLIGSSRAGGSIHWKACPSFYLADGSPDAVGSTPAPTADITAAAHLAAAAGVLECADLKVPLNYAKPHGRMITLAISLLPHTSSAANYKGVMLSNPGGPGASGVDLGPYLASAVPHGVGGDYDWVSWDPRGVGASRPAIRCKPNYFNGPRRSYDPTTKSLLTYWLHRSKSYADACEKRYPALLRNMTTLDSARDMDAIRRAVGARRISYYGYSYGTYLGQVYSTLHPQRVFRMVLDSNVDPRRVWYRANLDQDRAFDRNIGIFFRWAAKYHSIYHLGSTQKQVRGDYYRELATLNRHPQRSLGPDEFADAMEGASYYQSTWRPLAHAWHQLRAGHVNDMIGQYESSDDPGDDNGFAVYNAVQCTDTQWPTKWSTWKHDAVTLNRKHPFFTWNNTWFNAPCLYWGAAAHRPVTINGTRTRSALLIDEKLDAATPYEGSLEVRKLYPHSSLIAEPKGTSHAYSLSGNACVDDLVATYLRTGHRPARKPGRGADTTCKPLPRPRP